MGTLSIESLEAQLDNLGIHSPVPKYPDTQVLQNPIDIYRSYLTHLLVPLVGAEPQVVYDSLQWTNNLGHGDILLVVPKLRLKGVKPAEYAKELASKVYSFHSTQCPLAHVPCLHSFLSPLYSSLQRPMAYSSRSSSISPRFHSCFCPTSSIAEKHMAASRIWGSKTEQIQDLVSKKSLWSFQVQTSRKSFMLVICEVRSLELICQTFMRTWGGKCGK